jgi:hypothetical protein
MTFHLFNADGQGGDLFQFLRQHGATLENIHFHKVLFCVRNGISWMHIYRALKGMEHLRQLVMEGLRDGDDYTARTSRGDETCL